MGRGGWGAECACEYLCDSSECVVRKEGLSGEEADVYIGGGGSR